MYMILMCYIKLHNIKLLPCYKNKTRNGEINTLQTCSVKFCEYAATCRLVGETCWSWKAGATLCHLLIATDKMANGNWQMAKLLIDIDDRIKQLATFSGNWQAQMSKWHPKTGKWQSANGKWQLANSTMSHRPSIFSKIPQVGTDQKHCLQRTTNIGSYIYKYTVSGKELLSLSI